MDKYIQSDRHRIGRRPLLFQVVMRKCASSSGFLQLIYRGVYRYLCSKRAIEISWRTKIGYGLYIGHAYGITINDQVKIGNNCNIHKGVTIGQENRGVRMGVPEIGNDVWIGVNATIVGGVTIGDDVLIAPNSYINCDVPSHSIVIGNPCSIKHCDNATEHYINNRFVENNMFKPMP